MTPPIAGLSFAISLVIIVLGAVWHVIAVAFHVDTRQQSLPTAVRILAGVSIVLVFLLSGMILLFTTISFAVGHHNNNRAVLADFTSDCEPRPHQVLGDRLVILRLDDVQAYTWRDISIRMMEDGLTRGMPTVAGVIAQNLATDSVLTRFLRQHGCNLEIALHGYDHGASHPLAVDSSYAEFKDLTEVEARRRIERALTEFSRALPKQPIRTFIPPENQVSTATRRVLPELGLLYLSSAGTSTYDYDTKTWNFINNEYVYAYSVIRDCEARFTAGHRLCIIMLHPQDYATDHALDTDRYRDYLWLLDDIQQRNMQVVTFTDLDRDPQLRLTAYESYLFGSRADLR